jgi:virginiamycin B lyase
MATNGGPQLSPSVWTMAGPRPWGLFGASALIIATLLSWSQLALSQVISEFPLPNSQSAPISITQGSDGALWFTEADANNVGRITTDGVITEFPIPTAFSDPVGITLGPDGALWFAESGANKPSGKIGRITTAGAITEFPVPTPGSLLWGITTGPDGALWFGEGIPGQPVTGKIGRITTAGVFTEFSTPTTAPLSITTGPDGALWFTESCAPCASNNSIGRITTAGVITEFLIPTAGSGPQGITVGPDGALWFTELNVNKIGRITTAGLITEFPVPTSNSGPMEITTGSDGALWFTEANTGQLGRITTAGAITEFPATASASEPFSITTGPDGALWFTEAQGNKIARFSFTPALRVSPASNVAASGPQGGPFSPTSFKYQLASGLGSLNYSISGIPSWLSASFAAGTATTSPVTVTFSLINVGSLSPNTYSATIAFTNLDTGQGTQTRTATLSVNPPALQVVPSNGIAASGTHGGPFSPSSFHYTLSATFGSLKYSVITPSWITASPASGTVTTSTKSVTLTINSSVRSLQPDTYIENIGFYNSTDNQGNATRAATLVVNPKDYKVTVRASPSTGGTVSGAGEVAEGSSTAVTATASSGFHFVQWTEEGHAVTTSSTYTFTMPSEAVSLVADFQKN